ncbi:TlpA family protein disulfide reductase [Pedobacter metabolipauper]|uniref:Thiol-disulfide isomerase/thioredoxin n=1 Tax=Pedobacter metabolipauper TaxID=425513 RepID=A0A4R6ST01_9SPHI|nr:TlpA disulfide reductase family protein [Pedobacter metabolipauper]TDQ07043.1 thiol-disulfide isomerase/thioredoxin [Pedobacter metabolipauper]
MNLKNILCGIIMLVYFSNGVNAQNQLGKPVEEPAKVLANTMNWLYYDRDYLRLSEDFSAFDQTSKSITKGQFLKQIAAGGYLPVRLIAKNASASYKLYKMPATTDQATKAVIQDYGKTLYAHYQKEGKKLPGFNFIDLNGKKYNETTTKGKIVVFKFWFVKCLPCRQEMPELNSWVAKYKNRKDILFVSLALDDPKALNAFLKKTKFDYAVVADQADYLADILKINQFPTHLIVNKTGLVAKVGDADVILKELTKEASL